MSEGTHAREVRPLKVLLDFDGTLVEPNVAIVLVAEFCPNGREVAHRIDQELHGGRMTLREAWAEEVALLPPDRIEEMIAYTVRNVPLRAGARELLGFLREEGIATAVVSGGLDFYIRPVLDREGIELPLFSDGMEPGEDGRLRVLHPHGHATCRLCGICKAQVVRQELPEGGRVIFVGDGSTDRYAAEVADVVFARHRLKGYCEATGIPYLPFEDFAPVTAQMRRWHRGEEPFPSRPGLGVRASACPISRDLALLAEGAGGTSA
jgi:2-hydroxy-3-keto-5-methylthiopentenyl-1-phosphate phosphatase